FKGESRLEDRIAAWISFWLYPIHDSSHRDFLVAVMGEHVRAHLRDDGVEGVILHVDRQGQIVHETPDDVLPAFPAAIGERNTDAYVARGTHPGEQHRPGRKQRHERFGA